jgi:hydroxymethylbilane synthase
MLDERLAGLVRVDLDPELFVPAPGQGALAVQTREGDGELGRLLSFLHDGEAAPCVVAERRLLALLEGGCHVPLGAHAVSIEGGLLLRAFFEVDGEARRAQVTAAAPEEAAQEAFRVLSGDAA